MFLSFFSFLFFSFPFFSRIKTKRTCFIMQCKPPIQHYYVPLPSRAPVSCKAIDFDICILSQVAVSLFCRIKSGIQQWHGVVARERGNACVEHHAGGEARSERREIVVSESFRGLVLGSLRRLTTSAGGLPVGEFDIKRIGGLKTVAGSFRGAKCSTTRWFIVCPPRPLALPRPQVVRSSAASCSDFCRHWFLLMSLRRRH